VRKKIIVPVLFVPAILFPCFAFSRGGEISGIGRLREGLRAGGIAFEETALSPGGGMSEAYSERGLLVRFGQNAPSPRQSGFPFFVLFNPFTGDPEGTGYLVSLCGELEKNPPLSAELAIVFTGSSGFLPSGRDEDENGFSVYADIPDDPESTLFWRLDFENFPPRSLRIDCAPEGEKAPLLLVEGIPALCDSLGIPYTLADRTADRAAGGREGAGQNADGGGSELLKFARRAGAGILGVRGLGKGPEENAGIGAAELSELLGAYADSLAGGGFYSGGLGINADYHYSPVRLPRGVLFITEKSKIIIALAAFAASSLAAIIAFSKFRNRAARRDRDSGKASPVSEKDLEDNAAGKAEEIPGIHGE
jgi:hypothetical protein